MRYIPIMLGAWFLLDLIILGLWVTLCNIARHHHTAFILDIFVYSGAIAVISVLVWAALKN